MATNGAGQQAFAPILNALATLQSHGDRAQKGQAHEFLEKFQKSTEAWSTTFEILQDPALAPEARVFAATTLKGKITFDLHQLPRESLSDLRNTLLDILNTYRAGPRPVRTQLCVCLANLAIQMTEWKDVVPLVVSTLGNDSQSIPCVLDFLRVLPEEVTEGRKINLTEEALQDRTKELLEDNAQQVITLLAQYSQSSESASKNPQLLECLNSWSREVPMNDIVNSRLLGIILDALSADEPFDAAVECICSILKETRDVDESMNIIQTLYPRICGLRPHIVQSIAAEDNDRFKGFTKIFAEAGESWVLLVARMPEQFRELVEAILECAARDREREAISYTFTFWYELKQYLTLEKYIQARLQYVDVYSKLVDIMIGHLQFPQPESGNEKDLFEGDREQEEKFREFRHQMGDVLKDCCEVIGVTECLRKSYTLIEEWVHAHGSQATTGNVPQWQKLEAPLFSLRAMGRMVPVEENIMLPQLIPLIVQIPNNEKIRFQAVMALGRYTEWTAHHPETLQPQLNYIMESFEYPSKEVVRGAALSFKFFCNDCAELLKDFTPQLQQFYETTLPKLAPSSQDEITDGVASVLAKQPADQVYESMKLFCDPVVKSIMAMADQATDDKSRLALADKLQLLTIFVQWVQPYVEPDVPNPAVKYCQEIFPVLAAIADNFVTCTPVVERICRCWRYMVLSYRTAMASLLPLLANKLVSGFTTSRQGCFLWATDSIVREFSEGIEHVDQATTDAVYLFYEQQATIFLRALNDLPPEELPDVIEDFFRLMLDILLYYPFKAIPSPLMASILLAASTSLTLLGESPLMITLHFLRDFLAYGGEDAPSSSFDHPQQENPPTIRNAVKQLLIEQGEVLVQRIMTGMMYSFPRDCFPDASGVLLGMFRLIPEQVAEWVKNTVALLPPGSINPQESERLINNINQRIRSGELTKVRTLLQDFTTAYRRRNVAPREGLGRLEATRFRFAG
ncbi:ARM repeat-containing protein [Patellaria atrata CBS 101060]|uniref:ARM repeat-containing protein n=1 Tax=Patellaria atrata CBS 101060 TaxID=1346257 RepID=A0A9P4S2Y9_9PEZI|nr:ARM repeat-containing protein [Patellaria atrata CBS 101060]